jgi:arsenical pump membrane protein
LSRRASLALLAIGGAAAIAAALAAPSDAANAASQAWPAFVLVAGLLLVGAAAAREGVFAATGTLASRAPSGAAVLLVALLLVVAVVTAVLNLDTAVVFMTPVLLHAARHRGVPDGPFLYGTVFMATSASLLLPGSNLTKLASVLVNNLPAAMLLSAHVPAHPRALLLGLDLGPNLFVTGSLSAVLWLQVARADAARPSILRYTLLGVVLVPLSLGLTLLTVSV